MADLSVDIEISLILSIVSKKRAVKIVRHEGEYPMIPNSTPPLLPQGMVEGKIKILKMGVPIFLDHP